MKLAAIYNVWDGTELLHHSIRSIMNNVDVIIIIYQSISNFGEDHGYESKRGIHHAILKLHPVSPKWIEIYYSPNIPMGGPYNEKSKRNMGLEIARNENCSHFLFLDCDEIYQDFGKAKQQYIDSAAEGSVCQMYTYFKRPTLRLKDVDNYYVPFIHKLNYDTVAGMQNYPFYCDPTRRVNCQDVILIDEKMHHFSWVRQDIEMKVRNSSAKVNIEKSQLLADYNNPACGPGYFVKDYQQELIEVENLFNINI